MNDKTEIQKDDEISLLDLFTVLLRYRKLIIGITLAFIILAIAGYFIYPAYQYKKAMRRANTHGIMQMEITQKARVYVSQDIDGFINRPELIYDSLYTAGMEEFEFKGGKISLNDNNKTTIMYLINLFWIKNLDLNGNVLIQKGQEHTKTFNVNKIGTVFEVTFKNKDSEMIKKFMRNLLNSCTVNIEENLRINANMMVNNYERIMNLPKVSESMQMILEKDYDTYVFLKDFLDGKEAVVKLVSEPVFVDDLVSLALYKNQFKKIGIIIIFAGFFLAVMLAFALNAIRNIKNDEEAMKKIKDALGNSDGK